jgi:MFS family permease
MLIIGFILMGTSALFIPYFSTIGVTLSWWGALLFVGRVGAATVETMSDVYFFKQIDGRNASLVGYYRRARPAAYIVAPLLASLLLGFELIELRELFYILGGVMFFAVFFALQLKDTK